MDPGLIENVRVCDEHERGFTLIEMMIVVAVIAVLAAIVVPTFFKESRKTKGASEITPMFAEFSIREEQYKSDSGVYLAVTGCTGTPSTSGVAATVCKSATDWTTLRINPPETTIFCKYEVTIGTAAGTNDPDGFEFTSPDTDWWYLEATCDMDNNSTKNSTYFTNSVDSRIQKHDEGF